MTKRPDPKSSYVDLLAGADAFGAALPRSGEAPERRNDRYVGIFYFLWLGQHGTDGPYDNTNILAAAPEAVDDPNHPLWGPRNAFHFWGEPLYGYYLNDDAWVLRKHVQLLTCAGIDFLVFDTTNASIYKNVYDVLFSIMNEVRLQGFEVPKFAFYTNTQSGDTIAKLYEDLYKPGRYKELWFHWKGKPLIIGDPEECGEDVRSFFTFRRNQWPFEERKTQHGRDAGQRLARVRFYRQPDRNRRFGDAAGTQRRRVELGARRGNSVRRRGPRAAARRAA